jgi:hypothetical protein
LLRPGRLTSKAGTWGNLGAGHLTKGENDRMKITSEFLEKMALQRNLQSAITHNVILAECIRDIQKDIDIIKLKVGIPRTYNDEKSNIYE